MIRPPVFLDRDGTVIVEKAYLSDPAGVVLENHAVAGLALLHARGYPLIVLSNQSGIGRGLFSERAADGVNARVGDLLREHGIPIRGWYMCPHAPTVTCECRKPLAGLALAAARDLQIELSGSYMIGDKRSDLELADAIGGTGILVTTGHGSDAVAWATAEGRPICADLRDAARFIVALEQE